MTTLAIVPARTGSKGIPNKNFRVLNGKPLWRHAVDVGFASCDHTVLSTDSRAKLERVAVVPRPRRLARDDTPMLDVVIHALEWSVLDCDVIVLLQPTQPLRKASHVHAALDVLERSDADSVVSVVEIPAHYSPDFALRVDDGKLVSFNGTLPTRRQDCRKAYSRDGTVYAVRRETVLAGSLYGKTCLPLVIPHSESCNLDTEEDWQRAEEMVCHA